MTLFGPATIKWVAVLFGVPVIFAGLLRLEDNQPGGFPRVLAGFALIGAGYWVSRALIQ